MYKKMPAEEYIKVRVEQFQGWYDKKAVKAKAAYFRVRITAGVGALIVPVAANLIPSPDIARYTTTGLSLIVSVAVGLDGIFHFGDQWKNYRSTEQFLAREKVTFQTGEGAYKGHDYDQAFALLVERCESQIAAENSATLNVIAAPPPENT